MLSRWSADTTATDERPKDGVIRMAADDVPTVADERQPGISTWRGELANRVEAYRVRRRKVAPDAAQSQSRLPFAEPVAAMAHDEISVGVDGTTFRMARRISHSRSRSDASLRSGPSTGA